MSKVIKKLANIATHTIAGVVLAIILLVLAVALAFSLPRVQTFAAHKIVDYLSEYTNTRVDIRAISVENISSLPPRIISLLTELMMTESSKPAP